MENWRQHTPLVKFLIDKLILSKVKNTTPPPPAFTNPTFSYGETEKLCYFMWKKRVWKGLMLFLWIYKRPLRVSCWDMRRPKYVVQADKTNGTSSFCGERRAWVQQRYKEFYIHGSVQRDSNLITVQQDATYSVYYISVGSSTCFVCWHPSSRALTTVITASGID